MGRIKTTKIFLPSRDMAIHCPDKARLEKWAEETGYTYSPIQIPPSQSPLRNLYHESRAAKQRFNVSREDEDQYVNDVALLRRVTMRNQRRVAPEDITEEERDIL